MQKKEPDNNNLLIAVILSMAVLMAWQLLYAGPKMREEQARQERAKQEQVQPQVAKPGEAAPPRQPGVEPAVEPITGLISKRVRPKSLLVARCAGALIRASVNKLVAAPTSD